MAAICALVGRIGWLTRQNVSPPRPALQALTDMANGSTSNSVLHLLVIFDGIEDSPALLGFGFRFALLLCGSGEKPNQAPRHDHRAEKEKKRRHGLGELSILRAAQIGGMTAIRTPAS